jgi:periplasmic divalent cation tolerance protein
VGITAGGTGPVLVLCTAGSSANANQIADALISEQVAACVQISPVKSIYRWEGAVHHDSEFSLQIKTSAERVSEVERVIKHLHTYELPEIIVLPIVGGSPEYLGWLADSARGVSQIGEDASLR